MVSKAWPFASSVTKSRSFNSPTKPSGELIADVTRHIAALNTSYLDLLLIHWPTAALREHWSARWGGGFSVPRLELDRINHKMPSLLQRTAELHGAGTPHLPHHHQPRGHPAWLPALSKALPGAR